MDITNFAQIMKMREGFAQNREKAKLGFSEHTFDKRDKLMDKNFGNKTQFLGIEDKFHEKRHKRKIIEINLSKKR